MHPRPTPRFPALAAAFLTLFAVALPARADSERWYILEMFGQRSGWMKSAQTTSDGVITTESEVNISLARGGQGMNISMSGTFAETPDGKPLSMTSSQKFATTDVRKSVVFENGLAKVTTQQGENTMTSEVAFPTDGWLPPAAAERYVRERHLAGDKEIKVSSVDPSSDLKVITTTRRIGAKETLTVAGQPVEVTRVTSEVSIMPGVPSTEFLDAEGDVVRTETAIGGIKVIMTLSSKEEATGQAAPANLAGPEVMVNTFVTPEGRITDARNASRVVLVISTTEGTLPDFPTTGAQTFERLSPTSARVTITDDQFSPAPEADADDASYLGSSAMINLGDDEIARLAKQAVSDPDAPAAERAEDIRRFVFRHIRRKNLGVGFATASETARSRAGDCTEHAVLLAALLRKQGTPARVASGLVYADQFAGVKHIFGYHMWAQALIEIDGVPRWVDLDAALSETIPFDATHVTLSTSALAEGDVNTSMVNMATTLGRLKIKVEETAPAPVPAGKPSK